MAEKKQGPPAFFIESGIPGVLLPSVFRVDTFLNVLKYKPTNEDLFVATYPKCGTTYVQQIIYLIYHDGVPATDSQTFFKCCPFMEVRGLEGIIAMPRPNAIKSHLPFSVIPYSDKTKYVYMARNPKDCVVSLYHHTFGTAALDYNREHFDDFFELFLVGAVEFGYYFSHLLSWYEHRNDENVLFLIYEETTKDPAATILKTANFMGKEYGEKIEKDAEFFANIVKYSSFDYMKTNMNDFYKKSKPGTHIRKGKVAGWKDTISEEQNEKLDALITKHLTGTEILKYWQQIQCI